MSKRDQRREIRRGQKNVATDKTVIHIIFFLKLMKRHTLTDACCPQIQATPTGSIWRNNKYVLSFQPTEFNAVTFSNAIKEAL